MENFCKLDISLNLNVLDGIHLPVYRTIRTKQKYSRWQQQTHDFIPIDILMISGRRAKDYLLDQLPLSVLQTEVPELSILEMNVPLNATDPIVGAHIDVGRIAALNYYMEVNGEVTSFPDAKFTAEEGDMYLMDVTKVHSISLTPGSRRRALSMSFQRTDYDTLRRLCASKVCK